MKCEDIHNGSELSFADIRVFAIDDGTEMMSLNVGKKMPTPTAKHSRREKV
jgi:hypothetical protein